MSTSSQIRLTVIDEVPRPVGNSLYQAFVTDYQSLVLAYHVQQDGVIAVLNHDVEWQCATLRFDLCVAMRIDSWRSEVPSTHPLGAHGLGQNTFYKVDGSDWVRDIRSDPTYSERLSTPLMHFVFAFRARVVQIVAGSFSVTVEKRALGAVSLASNYSFKADASGAA